MHSLVSSINGIEVNAYKPIARTVIEMKDVRQGLLSGTEQATTTPGLPPSFDAILDYYKSGDKVLGGEFESHKTLCVSPPQREWRNIIIQKGFKIIIIIIRTE